jgi:hypothetical protein
LPFAVIAVIEIEHHPIVSSPQMMRSGRVGKESGKMPTPTIRMQNGEPGLALRVETFGCDSGQEIRFSTFAVLFVYLEEEVHCWFSLGPAFLTSQPMS